MNSDSDFQNFSSIDNQVAHYVSMLNICTCMCNLQWSKHALKNSTHTVSKNKNDVLPMQIYYWHVTCYLNIKEDDM